MTESDKDKTQMDAPPAHVQLSAEQLATPPSSPPHVGGRQVAVIVGPYRGNMLIMPEGEAQQAIDDHWAVPAPSSTFDAANPPEHGHDVTDEERAYAVEAANAWAAAQNPAPAPPAAEHLPAGETETQQREREQRARAPAKSPEPQAHSEPPAHAEPSNTKHKK